MTMLHSPTQKRFGTILVSTVLMTIPFYAFLTVWASTFLGHYTLLRLYPDLLLLVGIIYSFGRIFQSSELRMVVFGSLLFRLACAYGLLVVALGLTSYLRSDVTSKAVFYGILVDLRFVAWFFVAWVCSSESDWLPRRWRQLVFWPLAVVAIFAILQSFVLPANFLSHFGYNKLTTIVSYQTINQDTPTIRAQSFLRGANPLGGYMALGLGLLAVGLWAARRDWKYIGLTAVSSLALILSFSRSGWLGAFIAVGLGLFLAIRQRRAQLALVALSAFAVLLLGVGFIVFRHSSAVQDAVLHVSSHSTAVQTSNAGHATAFREGVKSIVQEPFGRGPGTAGPASFYNGSHGERNSESYFLQIGQELGITGLLLFITINLVLGLELWQRRQEPLATGLFATLTGLSILNQLAYGWSDPTLAYLWWGLAGITVSMPILKIKSQTERT